jgi:hypothetical protein
MVKVLGTYYILDLPQFFCALLCKLQAYKVYGIMTKNRLSYIYCIEYNTCLNRRNLLNNSYKADKVYDNDK